MPVVFSLFGILVAVICLSLLTKVGRAWWQKKWREAVEEDRQRFGSDDSIG